MNPIILKAVLQIIGDKALTFVALIFNFGLFAYAVAYPDYLRFATAVFFAISVFIPILKLRPAAPAPAPQRRVQEEEESEAA